MQEKIGFNFLANYLWFVIETLKIFHSNENECNFEERWIWGNLHPPLTGVYPNIRKVGIRRRTHGWWLRWVNTAPSVWIMDSSCVGVYKQRDTGRGMVQRNKLCDHYDRLREKERGVLWRPTRRFDAYTPYRGQRLFPSFSRLYVVVFLLLCSASLRVWRLHHLCKVFCR